MQKPQKKCFIMLCLFALFQTLAMANSSIQNMLSVDRAPMAVESTRIFSIGTTHGSTDSINSVIVTACNFSAASWFDCFNADNNGSEASAGSIQLNVAEGTGGFLAVSS